MNPFINYKSKVASRYIPVDAEQIGLKIAESDYYLMSIKYDGHLAFLSTKSGKAELYNRKGEILNIPAITEAASKINKEVILAGEICCFESGKSTSHREVNSALSAPDKNDLRFGVFDILELGGKSIEGDVREKSKIVSEIATSEKVFTIEQKFVESRKDIIDFYKDCGDEIEGLVVRSANGIVYKVKSIFTLDLVVLGYAESTGEREGYMRDLLLGFCLGNNTYQIVTKCGSGFSDLDRKEFPEKLEKLIVQSEYTEVSGAKTAFMMVKPELVVEISCLDLINETNDGAIQKSVLKFDPKNGYSIDSNANTLSIISPNFVRIRSDKSANEQDAGTNQAYGLVEPLKEKITESSFVDSKIILREVYTKAGKTGTAVRKFLGIKTNKETSGQFSPYLIMYSDYSGDRKTPLEQELFLCETENDMKAKISSLKEENIKKGWISI
jgi:ATP-dependent DNA ligase